MGAYHGIALNKMQPGKPIIWCRYAVNKNQRSHYCGNEHGGVHAALQEADAMGHGYLGAPRESEDIMREVILLAACSPGEVLPQTPDLPADVFTACLTTPIKVGYQADTLASLSSFLICSTFLICCHWVLPFSVAVQPASDEALALIQAV